MNRFVIVLILLFGGIFRLQAQEVTGYPQSRGGSDTTIAPIPDTTQKTANQVPDSVSGVAPEAAPINYGTVTQVKDLNQYNPSEVLTELKQGSFGHPIDRAKDTVRWKKGGVFGVNMNQGTLQNWAAGGDRFSLSLGTLANFYANYADKHNNWDNNVDMAFGYLNTTSLGMRKSDDRLNLYSKYGYQFSKNWYYSVMVSFRSQFANGYLYPDDSTVVSHFLAPAYILGSVGLNFKPVAYFSVFMSPITSRFVIVNDRRLADLGAFGVDSATYDYHDSTRTLLTHGSKMQYEFGPYVSIQFAKDVMKNVNWTTRLDLYSNYLRNPQNVDIYWTSLFALKVNKFISASLDTELIYDDDVKFITYAKNADGSVKTDPVTGDQIVLKRQARIQFKELIGLGFSLQF